jgi:hypothetical protein
MLQLIVDALWPGGVEVVLKPIGDGVPGALRMDLRDPNAPARAIRHWRHKRHFQELGKKGAAGYVAKVPPSRRSTFARRAARARWRRARERQTALGDV